VFVIDAPETRFKRAHLVALTVAVIVVMGGTLLVRPWASRSVPEQRPVISVPRSTRAPDVPPQETEPQIEQPPAQQPIRQQQPRPARPAPSSVPAVPALEPGTLFVNATPWGQLYVDGDLVGNTPRVVTVAPGTHSIRVVQEGFEPFETEIQIASGQQLRLTDIELRARQP
jgi:hypothetical protein